MKDIICKYDLPFIIQHHLTGAAYTHGREPDIFCCQAACFNGLQAIFQSAEISVCIIRSEGEFDSAFFCFADDFHAGDLVTCVDFECDVVFFQYIQDAVDTFVGPVFGLFGIQLFGQEGRIGIDVGRIVGKDLDGLVHQVIHVLFFCDTVVVHFFGAVYP